jgi:Fe2+ transport system protein FeoA
MQMMNEAALDHDLAHTLCEARAGEFCRVDGVFLDADVSARLAGLGVSVGRHMRVVRSSEPLVVQVYGTRIGIARVLADKIQVSTGPASAAPAAEIR